jgi:site-specific DNA recombinase
MRAAAYIRVSTEEQASEGHSLDAQRERILDYIQFQKWTLVGSYTDPGFSGKNLNRPDMTRLLNEVRSGHLDLLVVHKLDRLTRNIGDLYELLALFEKHKVKFVSISENIDTSSAMGRMFVFLLGIFAQWYRENLSEEVKKGMSQRVKKGLPNITKSLFGYTFDDIRNMVIDPNESKWVRYIFDQYLAGIGTRTIALRLNDMGIRRAEGGRWTPNEVRNTISNIHYIGKVHWKEKGKPENERIIADGMHEPIISAETFEAAQHLMNRRKNGHASKNSYDYVFGGIIRCGSCGGKYKGKGRMNGKNVMYRSYTCHNRAMFNSCDSPTVSEIKLAQLLFNSLTLLPQIEYHAEPKRNERDEIDQLIKASETRRERWQMAYGDGIMLYEDFSKRMKQEMERLTELQERRNNITDESPSTITTEEATNTLRELSTHWHKLERLTQKQIMQSIFRSITISYQDAKWRITSIITN